MESPLRFSAHPVYFGSSNRERAFNTCHHNLHARRPSSGVTVEQRSCSPLMDVRITSQSRSLIHSIIWMTGSSQPSARTGSPSSGQSISAAKRSCPLLAESGLSARQCSPINRMALRKKLLLSCFPIPGLNKQSANDFTNQKPC